MCLVVFQIHLNHVSSLVVLPKMTGETALVRSDKRRQREKERKGRKERNERTCPQDVLKMLLAEIFETIDILGEMLRL